MKAKPVYRAEDLIISDWEELTPAQVLKVVPHVFNDDSNEVALLQLLFRDKKIFSKLNKYQVYDLLTFTDWVSSTFFKSNLIPEFKHNGQHYYGPESALGNVTLIEFAKADNYYIKYLESKNDKYLNQLIATLYRPKKSFWKIRKGEDVRKEFNHATIEKDAEVFTDLKKELKQYMLLFFIGCKDSLFNTYRELFETDEKEGEGSEPKPTHEKLFRWAGIIYDLAETPVFSGIEAAKKANLHTALIYLNKKAIENKIAAEKNRQKAHEQNKKY